MGTMGQPVLVAGPFREDADGHTVFDALDGRQDGLQALFEVVPIEEQAVEQAHPGMEQRDMLHLVFGDVAGTAGDAHIGQQDVKEAAVVGYVEDRRIFGDVLFSDHRDRGAGDADAQPKDGQHDLQGAGIPQLRGELSNDPFDEQERDGEDQKSDDHDAGQ